MDEYTRKNEKSWYFFRSTVYRAASNILNLAGEEGDTSRIYVDEFHKAFLPVRRPLSGETGWWQNCRVACYHELSPTSLSNEEETDYANDDAWHAIYFFKSSASVRGGEGRWVCQPYSNMQDTDLYQMLSVYLVLTECGPPKLSLTAAISFEDLTAVITKYEQCPERLGLAEKEGPAFLRGVTAIVNDSSGEAGDGNKSAKEVQQTEDAELLTRVKQLLAAKTGIADQASALKT